MSTNRSRSNREQMLNHLLEAIVITNSGEIKSKDKNALLRSWLISLGGSDA